MDCYVCNIDTFDENHCERCRYELQPLIEWVAEETGDSSFLTSNIPFLELHADEARLIKGFIAGGMMPFIITKTRLVRTDQPSFKYAPFKNAL